ncbi:MAG: twin-arginine translocase TatA/TatE family subunit [Thermomicrobiales bacterium]|nr:twin-arginine translocase TatA/TatE family subunit [Thermomicrobiales bacterium]
MFGPGLGWQELVLILLIVAMIFGTSKLSGIGSDLGKSIKEFKKEAGAVDEPDSIASGGSTGSTATVARSDAAAQSREMRADEI